MTEIESLREQLVATQAQLNNGQKKWFVFEGHDGTIVPDVPGLTREVIRQWLFEGEIVVEVELRKSLKREQRTYATGI